MSRKRCNKIWIFHLLVQVADERLSCSVACRNITDWFLYRLTSLVINNSHHAVNAEQFQNFLNLIVVDVFGLSSATTSFQGQHIGRVYLCGWRFVTEVGIVDFVTLFKCQIEWRAVQLISENVKSSLEIILCQSNKVVSKVKVLPLQSLYPYLKPR